MSKNSKNYKCRCSEIGEKININHVILDEKTTRNDYKENHEY